MISKIFCAALSSRSRDVSQVLPAGSGGDEYLVGVSATRALNAEFQYAMTAEHPTLAQLAQWARLDDAFRSLPFLVLIGLVGLCILVSIASRMSTPSIDALARTRYAVARP